MADARVGSFLIVNFGDDPQNPRDPKALRYIADVKKELDRITRSQAGRALIHSIAFHKKVVTIMPYDRDGCGAEEAKVGDNDSLVLFTADLVRKCFAEAATDDRSAALPHEMLHHELFHALRRISGKNKPMRLHGQRLPNFGNSEEFLAITMTNIFISDVSNKHKSSLRAAWSSHHKLSADADESFTFFSFDTGVYNIISRFCGENPGYAGLMAQVRARFNPVAAMMRSPRRAFEISATAMDDDVWDAITIHHMMQGMVPLKSSTP